MSTDYDFRIFGLRRSGNHAIIAWILSAFEDNSVYYFNDVLHDYDKLYNTMMISCDDEKMGNAGCKLVQNPKWNEHKRCIIQTYEDCPLTIINEIDKQNIPAKYRFNILILRDIHNLVASRLELYRNGSIFTEVTQDLLSLWNDHAKEFLQPNTINVCINYNKWNHDKIYRNNIAQQLNIQPREELKLTLRFGNLNDTTGSSFTDGKLYNVRWHKYKNDPEFIQLLGDNRLFNIAAKIFNS